MTPSELLGRRIADARKSTMVSTGPRPDVDVRSMHQEELGALLQPYLGRAWSKVIVSAVETGRRELGPTEILAFAMALGRPVDWFFRPSREADSITMPSGRVLTAGEVRSVVDGPAPSGAGFVLLPGGARALLHGDEREPIGPVEALKDIRAQLDDFLRRYGTSEKESEG